MYNRQGCSPILWTLTSVNHCLDIQKLFGFYYSVRLKYNYIKPPTPSSLQIPTYDLPYSLSNS